MKLDLSMYTFFILIVMDELLLGHVSKIETNFQSILIKQHLYTSILINCIPFIKIVLVS
jgi:hypothetical protein